MIDIINRLAQLNNENRVDEPVFANLTIQFQNAIISNPDLLNEIIDEDGTTLMEYTIYSRLWDCTDTILDIINSEVNPIENSDEVLAETLFYLLTDFNFLYEEDLPLEITKKFVLAGADIMKEFGEDQNNIFDEIFLREWSSQMSILLNSCSEDQMQDLIEEYNYRGDRLTTKLHSLIIDSDTFNAQFIDLVEAFGIRVRCENNLSIENEYIMDHIQAPDDQDMIGNFNVPMDEDF